jgi:hypothetical protein
MEKKDNKNKIAITMRFDKKTVEGIDKLVKKKEWARNKVAEKLIIKALEVGL